MSGKVLYLIVLLLFGVFAQPLVWASNRQSYTLQVDKQGVLRRSDTGAEAAYYGTNYTAPFAHAYRALGYLGVDRKEAIRRDVYHLARLGLNAFRLHLWDVELSDERGNLRENDHLDLLDFLIAELERRGIDIVLTAQTDFGNGYPERNIDTGGFAYLFDKCDIHSNPQARKCQENYLRQLASHVNPYTGLSYGADRAIIAMEINNEPCHTAPSKQVTDYIKSMVKALRRGGFDKPILYNVTHNPDVTEAYYKANIQGTTFQWYPTGLVNGRERHGNFLPHVDNYTIPWEETMPGYRDKARFIYEFDPGDVLHANMYPAIVRTLRGKGFQWITQFAYDPTDIARFNTEYQTHFLNLAYTPSKALSMLIAAEAMHQLPRGADFGSYPQNKNFGHFSLSTDDGANSLYNSPTKYYSTADTEVVPLCIDSLQHLAGVGGNPVVSYCGTGAWFLDKLDSRHWRLEVMPDVIITEDPFKKPSLRREVAQIVYASQPMNIRLPSLGADYRVTPLNMGNTYSTQALQGSIDIKPGVYLLSVGAPEADKWTPQTPFGANSHTAKEDNMLLGEYVAPAPSPAGTHLTHTARLLSNQDSTFSLSATALNTAGIDSVVLYPASASFWNEHNELYTLRQSADNPYLWLLHTDAPIRNGDFGYRLVVFSKEDSVTTFPGAIAGTPLDWDFPEDSPLYTTRFCSGAPLPLLHPYVKAHIQTDVRTLPQPSQAYLKEIQPHITDPELYSLEFVPPKEVDTAVIQTDISTLIEADPFIADREYIELQLACMPAGMDSLEIGVIDHEGVSYTVTLTPSVFDDNLNVRIPLRELKAREFTYLLPVAYPTIAPVIWRYGESNGQLQNRQIASAVIVMNGLKPDRPVNLTIASMIMQ